MPEAKITLGAIDNTKPAFDSVKSQLQGLHTSASAVLGALGAFGSVAMFAGMIKGSIDAAAGLNDLSIQTGATVEALSALGEIGRLSDVSTEMIGNAMNKLAKNMAGATEESKGTGTAIAALGINFDTFKKLSPEDQMMAVAKAMDKSADGSGKAAVAMAVYGKEGAKMLPFLKDLAVAGDLQAIVTKKQVAMADNFNDNLTKLQVSGKAWVTELAMGMIPALDLGTQAFTDVLNETGGLREEVRKLAADGSIKSWTQAGITGLTYVADAAQYVIRAIKATGESIGAYAAAGVAYFGGIGKALGQVMTGDFSGAVDSMKSGMDASKTIIKSLGDSLITTFGEDTLGSRIRARMKEIESTGVVAEKIKPNLDFTNQLNKNAKAAKEGAKAAKDLEKAYTELVKTAQTLANAKNAEADGVDAWFQAEEKVRLATVKAANDSVQAAQDEYDNFGKTKSQIAEVTLARLNDKLQGVNAGTEIAASIGLQIDAQQRLIGIMQKGEVREASVEAAKDATTEWKKTTDDISRGLTDSLFRAFEAGKGFFSTLWSGIQNLFKTTALKLIINPVSTAITGVISSGMSGAANAATGSGGGMLSNLSSANSLYSLASTGYAATLGSSVGAVFGATAGNAAIATAITGSASSATAAALAASQAAGTATAASATLASVGSSIAAAMPYVAAALAVVAIISKIMRNGGVPTASTGDSQIHFDAAGNETRRLDLSSATFDAMASSAADGVVKGLQTGYAALAASLGVSTTASAFAYSGNTGEGGEKPNFALSGGAGSGYYNSGDLSANDANMQMAVSRLMLVSLQGSELPKYLKGAFDGMAVGSMSQEQIAGALSSAQALKGFHDQLQALPFESMKDLSFAATQAMIGMAGGLDNLKTALGGFVDNFYTDAEKAAMAQKNIATALASVGFKYTAGDIAQMTRAQYRQIYEAHVAAFGPENPISMMLLNVAASFAAITPVAEAAAAAVDSTAAALQAHTNAQKDALQAMDAARGNLVSAYERESGALQSTISRFKDFSTGIKSFKDSLLLGSLSALTPAQKYAAAQGQFQKTSALANAGDATALGQMQGVSEAFLQASQAYNASGAQYISDFALVSDALDNAAIGALATADVARLQLGALDAQLGWLNRINDSVMSVAGALAQYKNAQVSLAAVDAIEGLYVGMLGRASDVGGKAGWTAAMASGMSVSSIAQAFMDSPEYLAVHGSHAGGLASVPFDGYRAELHKGERVLTAQDNAIFSRSSQGQGNAELVAEIKVLNSRVASLTQTVETLREQNNQGHAMNAEATVSSSVKNADTILNGQSRIAFLKKPEIV